MRIQFLFLLLLTFLPICKSQDKAKIEKMLEFVYVEGGTFIMGDSAFKSATPHEVVLSSFNMQKTEVTQELYEAVMGINPSEDKTWRDYPVTNVSWIDCQIFIEKLNTISGKNTACPQRQNGNMPPVVEN